MIRLVLLTMGFLAVTVALLVFQPGSNRRTDLAPVPEPTVTRAEPAFTEDPVLPDTRTPTAQPVAPLGLPDQSAAFAGGSSDDAMDDASLRRMTWSTLSNLNQATGRESAPGQPGSLLHTIVRRSLDDTGVATAAPPSPTGAGTLYVVQPGDSLISIAEAIYGDVNMTGPLFAANQAILSRPDDLREGQTLVLPIR